MIRFESKDFSELEEEIAKRLHEISVATLTAVCKGIEENADVIALGFSSSLDVDVIVTRENYLNALELNLQRAVEVEEFELCAKAQEYIKILKLEQEKEV
jgi:hypothetical protein